MVRIRKWMVFMTHTNIHRMNDLDNMPSVNCLGRTQISTIEPTRSQVIRLPRLSGSSIPTAPDQSLGTKASCQPSLHTQSGRSLRRSCHRQGLQPRAMRQLCSNQQSAGISLHPPPSRSGASLQASFACSKSHPMILNSLPRRLGVELHSAITLKPHHRDAQCPTVHHHILDNLENR